MARIRLAASAGQTKRFIGNDNPRYRVVLLASAVSSTIGFAFSALCGALLFHVIDSPVYAVQVMIICSIAIQMFGVATLWHAIDWRSLRAFLIGGLPGKPVVKQFQYPAVADVVGDGNGPDQRIAGQMAYFRQREQWCRLHH